MPDEALATAPVIDLSDIGPAAEDAAIEIEGRWQPVTWARRVALVAALGVVVSVLIANVKRSQSALDIVRSSHPQWIAAVVAATVATYGMSTLCTMSSTPLALRPLKTFTLQVAASFVNRFVPGGVAGAVLNVRYIEHEGASRSAAVSANVLKALIGIIVHVLILLALLPVFGGVRRDIDPPDHMAVMVVAFVVFLVAGAAMWARWLPHHLRRPIRAALNAFTDAARSPRRLVLLFGGSAGATAAHGIGLWCALHAVGAPVPLVDVMVVYLVAAAAASVSPTPGGLGAIEVALVAGLTRSGAAATPVAAAVLVYRVISYWLPILPGYIAFRWLRRTAAI